MKRFALLVLVFISAFTSCSLDDDTVSVRTETMAIESVDMPDHFVQGESYEILITYNRPSNCYLFYDFFYQITGNERVIAVIDTVYVDSVCVEESVSATVSLNFKATGTETYLFKFYQGVDESGEDLYYLVEVPVINSRPVSK